MSRPTAARLTDAQIDDYFEQLARERGTNVRQEIERLVRVAIGEPDAEILRDAWLVNPDGQPEARA